MTKPVAPKKQPCSHTASFSPQLERFFDEIMAGTPRDPASGAPTCPKIVCA